MVKKTQNSKNINAGNSKTTYDYDAIIIGTGPGGEGAAMKLTKQEQNVAVIERYKSVGGGCTHWGTIPSKALRQSVSQSGRIPCSISRAGLGDRV